jgi:putative ABC transport system permease protein
MNLARNIRKHFAGLTRQRELDAEMDEEMRSHIEMRTQRNIAAGMSQPEARYEALKRFGWMDSIKQTCREERRLAWLHNLVQDVRYGARMLLRSPGFTSVALLTLALGIGANTAIFSLINAVLFRPLPFREPSRLVWITNPDFGGAGIPGMTRSVNVRDWRELNHSFDELGCYVAWFGRQQNILTVNGESTRVEGTWVDRKFLKVLGVSPSLGRDFQDEDGHQALILTDRFWRRQFRADRTIVGRSITISGKPWTVVGVLPAAFDFSSIFTPGSKVDFLRPSMTFGDLSDNSHAVIGRLKPGVTLRQAQLDFDRLNQQLRAAHPERGGFGASLIPLRERVSGQFRRPFLVLACAVGCVLLITCVNLSNLLLARAAARRKEIAVRLALGAGRWRLIRQMLTESLLLAGCGAAVGVPLAHLATAAVAQSHAFGIPLLESTRVDGMALGFALVMACSAGLLFGLVPALQFSSQQSSNDLKEAARGSSSGRRAMRIREGLVISEVALACVLLVGAGLLTRSFVRLLQVDLGFQPERVATCRIRTNRDFSTNSQKLAYFEDLSQRIAALPGVESVGFTLALPFAARDVVKVRAEGQTYPAGEYPSVFLQDGNPGFFKTLGIPLLAGRSFESRDTIFETAFRSGATLPVLVNEKMARTIWPGNDAVGKIVYMNDNGNAASASSRCEVIGVVGNVRQNPLEVEAAPQIYVPSTGGQLVVRTKGTFAALAPAVRAVVRQVDGDVLLEDFKSLSQMVDQVVSPKRLILLLVGLFSLLALFLASVGIYGVIAYSVSQRTQEIGIRLALGSPKTRVLGLIIGKGMKLAVIGCATGLLAAVGLTRVMQALLFAISPTDPLTFVASGLLLLGIAALACWLPGVRAMRVDPIVALRQE